MRNISKPEEEIQSTLANQVVEQVLKNARTSAALHRYH